jgi:hypothetical protein
VRLDLGREGLGSIVVVTPIAVEAWTPSWWNDRGHVEFTMHGRVRPIIGNGCCGGARVTPNCARDPSVVLGRG